MRLDGTALGHYSLLPHPALSGGLERPTSRSLCMLPHPRFTLYSHPPRTSPAGSPPGTGCQRAGAQVPTTRQDGGGLQRRPLRKRAVAAPPLPSNRMLPLCPLDAGSTRSRLRLELCQHASPPPLVGLYILTPIKKPTMQKRTFKVWSLFWRGFLFLFFYFLFFKFFIYYFIFYFFNF